MGGSISKKNSEAERLNARAMEGELGNSNAPGTTAYVPGSNRLSIGPGAGMDQGAAPGAYQGGGGGILDPGGGRGGGGGGMHMMMMTTATTTTGATTVSPGGRTHGPASILFPPPGSTIPMGGISNSTVSILDGTSLLFQQQSLQQQQQQQQPTEVVPTVFRWEHGGNNVYITGTFNNWSRRVQMHRSGNDFIYIQSLPKGKHAYKFVVDDEWRFAPDQSTIADSEGNINNYIDLSTFVPDDNSTPVRRDSIPGEYGHILPDEDEYSKDPPLLPPHLRHIILNFPSPDARDALQLPTPQHVTLNHLYCTAIKDGLMVQAVTHRYRRKHTTSVYYTVMPPSSLQTAQATAAAAAAAAAAGVGGSNGSGAAGYLGVNTSNGSSNTGGGASSTPNAGYTNQQPQHQNSGYNNSNNISNNMMQQETSGANAMPYNNGGGGGVSLPPPPPPMFVKSASGNNYNNNSNTNQHHHHHHHHQQSENAAAAASYAAHVAAAYSNTSETPFGGQQY